MEFYSTTQDHSIVFKKRVEYDEQGRAYSGIQSRSAWSLDREINSTRNRIYSLKSFYFLLYRRRCFLLVSEFVSYAC